MNPKPLVLKLRDDKLNLDFYTQFLPPKLSQDLFTILDTHHEWMPNRRQHLLYGDPGLIYRVTYGGTTAEYPTYPWDQLPVLSSIKALIEQVTGDVYTVCVIQHYPNGKIGINPHRDKEMKPGTTIAGISLGETRTLTMSRHQQTIPLRLNPGSLYIFHPPTNDYWAHSIEKDDTLNARISLTFRNY